MSVRNITKLIDPASNLPLDEWLDRLEDIAEDHGFFEPLGPDHSAMFVEGDAVLLVTFETIDGVRSRAATDVPLGWELAERHNWSQLCLMSHGETWFRHRAIYQFFDRMVDQGFFDDFDQVVFYGAESCGYAAAAYSVASPGATVLAISPQATLDPRLTEWDNRFDHMRRTSFTDRYGFAPDMIDAAASAYVLYDPEIQEDAMHSALFHRPHVNRIRCHHLNGQIETYLRRMERLDPLLLKAMNGSLRPLTFYRALRERRSYLPYLRRLLSSVEAMHRPYLTAILCRSVLSRINTPRFRRQLTLAEQELARTGRTLPKPRTLVPG